MVSRTKAQSRQHHQAAHDEDGPICPLCIEVLDAFERNWLPCPCGYQVCAFCYERLNRDLGKQCPGCRTEYGSFKVVTNEAQANGTSPDEETQLVKIQPPQKGVEEVVKSERLQNEAEGQNVLQEPSQSTAPQQTHRVQLTEPLPNQETNSKSPVHHLDKAPSSEVLKVQEVKDSDEEEATMIRPRIQPTKIKTRPWGNIDTGQNQPEAVQESPALTESVWPVLGGEGNAAVNSSAPPAKNGQTIYHQNDSAMNPQLRNPKGSTTEASERLAAFLGKISQQQQNALQQAATQPSFNSTPVNPVSQPQNPTDLRPQTIRPPPGYDQPQPYWSENVAKQLPQNPQNPIAESAQANQADVQEKLTKWWQTMNSARPQNVEPPSQGADPKIQQTLLSASDSVQDLVRQAADAHGAYSGTPPPGFVGEESEKPPDPYSSASNGVPLVRQTELDGSGKSMEKLYNIWPPNARSGNDSAGPSSFNSNHNMWAVPSKQSNPMSSLWYPQNQDPIPNGLQELWDKPTHQLISQNSQVSNLAQEPMESQNQIYQDLHSLSSGHRLSESQLEGQLAQFNQAQHNLRNLPSGGQNLAGLNQGQTQGYGPRFFQGNAANYNQNGLGQNANTFSSAGLNNLHNNLAAAQSGLQNQNYGGQANLQASQAYLQSLQLQAALSKQGSANQQTLLQAQQTPRYANNPPARSAYSQGLQGYNSNGVPQASQQISQNLAGLANLGNLNLPQAYANELLGQMNLNSNQNLGAGNSLLNGRTNLQQSQQYGGNVNQIYGGANSLNGGNVTNGATELNTFRLKQAIQALNIQQSLNSNSTLQNLQNMAAQERQRQILELWSKQQQQQSGQQTFSQNQNLRQDQSRFSSQFGGANNLAQRGNNLGGGNQANYQQNLGLQSQQNQILQQNRLGRSGSPFGRNPNIGNRMYQQ